MAVLWEKADLGTMNPTKHFGTKPGMEFALVRQSGHSPKLPGPTKYFDVVGRACLEPDRVRLHNNSWYLIAVLEGDALIRGVTPTNDPLLVREGFFTIGYGRNAAVEVLGFQRMARVIFVLLKEESVEEMFHSIGIVHDKALEHDALLSPIPHSLRKHKLGRFAEQLWEMSWPATHSQSDTQAARAVVRTTAASKRLIKEAMARYERVTGRNAIDRRTQMLRLGRLIRALHARIGDPRSKINGAIERAGSDRSTLVKRFKRVFGVDLRDWQRSERMELAWWRLQLAHRSNAVCDVARGVGYPKTSRFVRDFVRHFGAHPGRYRWD